MEWKVFWTAFATLFLAELGDKTQLAVITLTGKTGAAVSVFFGAVLALVLVTLIGVLFGEAISSVVPAVWLERIAGAAFIIIGVLMLWGRL